MTKTIIFYTFAFLTILIFSGLYYLDKNEIIRVFNKNELIVETDQNLSKNKVKIEFGFMSIDRKSDLEVLNTRSRLKTIHNSFLTKKVPADLGENDFLVTYDETFYLTFRHFIENDFTGGIPEPNDYHIYLSKVKDTTFLSVDIKGDQPMKFKRAMLKMKDANKYRCNSLIDSTKVMYNMIELK